MDEQELREAKQQLYAKLCEARSLALDIRDAHRKEGAYSDDYHQAADLINGMLIDQAAALRREGIPLE